MDKQAAIEETVRLHFYFFGAGVRIEDLDFDKRDPAACLVVLGKSIYEKIKCGSERANLLGEAATNDAVVYMLDPLRKPTDAWLILMFGIAWECQEEIDAEVESIENDEASSRGL